MKKKSFKARLPFSLTLRQTVFIIAVLNYAYFGVELFYAFNIGSVSLMADSVDFFEDASVSLLVFFALVWPVAWRQRIGTILAINTALPALGTVWSVWHQVTTQIPPAPLTMSLVGIGALVVNSFCALLMFKERNFQGGLARAVYLCSRNDVIINILIIITAAVTAHYPSVWPDILVGTVIALLHLGAASDIYKQSRKRNPAAHHHH